MEQILQKRTAKKIFTWDPRIFLFFFLAFFNLQTPMPPLCLRCPLPTALRPRRPLAATRAAL
jgi:hypothetical protein